MKIQRSIRLSPEADEALRVIALRQERSVSQLIELAVRSHYLGHPGERSTDGRESARTRAARESGMHHPAPSWAAAPPLSKQQAETPLPKIAPRKRSW
jgi:predicted transcriptional regulator